MEQNKIISQAIVQMLARGRRVVIPGLGAFIRKEESNEIVFTELMKKDDGRLAAHLTLENGFTEDEARVITESFSRAVRDGAGKASGYQLDGIGALTTASDNTIKLVQSATPEAETPKEREADTISIPTPDRLETPKHETTAHISAPATSESTLDNYSPVAIEHDDVKNLRYQKAVKIEVPHERKSDKRRADMIMIIAIAAALLAIASMLYGYFNAAPPPEIDLTEQTAQ